MIELFTALVLIGGFGCLFLSMPRHHQDWLGRKAAPATERALRLAGFGALLAGFLLLGVEHGWAYGAVAWAGWLTLTAAIVVTVNVHRDRVLRRVKGGRG
ncbi:DUF3325 domain-containing protein [Sphingomonas sp.]|uniref:DUF3325 domain-containing protein n=1 Tax=Sphingomonas sp. TaxID=28214 RepID=UPI0031D2293E